MTDTQQAAGNGAVPGDPAMAVADPAMFALLTSRENKILTAHLFSGWYKQSAVYSTLSEPWRETSVLLDDLHRASPEAGS